MTWCESVVRKVTSEHIGTPQEGSQERGIFFLFSSIILPGLTVDRYITPTRRQPHMKGDWPSLRLRISGSNAMRGERWVNDREVNVFL